MKKNLRLLAGAAVGAAVAFGFTSCTYDPYYSSASVGGSYRAGYGDGYGYGGRSFSTSAFIRTGDPRWGYDPYSYSYYDYTRRAYYDPYLHGYYPVGFRPAFVYGVPHPYGWRPGIAFIRPPIGIRNVTVVNYRNRESAYRSSNYSWARQVRQQPVSAGRVQGQHPAQGSSVRQRGNIQPTSGYHPSTATGVHDTRAQHQAAQATHYPTAPSRSPQSNRYSQPPYPRQGNANQPRTGNQPQARQNPPQGSHPTQAHGGNGQPSSVEDKKKRKADQR